MYPVGRYIIILTREGWGTSTHPPYFEHCTGAPSPNGASASAPVPFRRRAGPPPPPAHRPLTENRQLYFEPGCIQDPFSDPFARALPSLSPSGLPRGRPFPSVPSPLSTGSSPPSPPPRAPGGAASRPLPSAAPPPAACLPTRWRSGPASGSKFKLHAHTSAFSLSLSSEQHFVFAARESVGQVRGQQWGREGPSVEQPSSKYKLTPTHVGGALWEGRRGR